MTAFTITIDDNDRDLVTEDPWNLTITRDGSSEIIELPGIGGALIGVSIPEMLRELADNWPAEAAQDPELVTLDLEIENIYPDDVITTSERGVIVPAPESYTEDDLRDWSHEHLQPFTGTGETKGDAGYRILITKSSVIDLAGRVFEIGI